MAPGYSKYALKSNDTDTQDTRRLRISAPPIPLDRPQREVFEDGTYVSFKLRAVPTDPDSQLYSLSVPFYNAGTPEKWILFRKNLDKVLIGQNITTGPPTYAMTRRILEGASLAKFEDSTLTRGTETLEHFTQVLEDMGAYVFPRRALQMEKRYMRRYMRKPRKLKMREYMARVEELNNDLRYFPTFVPGATLHQDELLDIYEYGIPARWQSRFLLHGFDPLEHTKQEFLEFCERLEATEDILEEQGVRRKTSPKDRYMTKEKSASTSRSGTSYPRNSNYSQKSRFCRLHGPNPSHDTANCKVILDQADKMKATWKTQPRQQQYQKKRFDSKKPYERNLDSRYNSDYPKKREFTSTEQKKTQFQMEKRHKPAQHEDQYMTDVVPTVASLPKDNTLDLENFNYSDVFNDDQNSNASTLNYMTPLDTSDSFTETDPE
jgi:hypothetical protein